MRIYLCGFMGSGKSKLGRKLAGRLDYRFIDLDEQIEKREGKTIPEIFSEKGEEEFRKTESEVLFSTSSASDCVIALGGGACCTDLNMGFIRESGLSIYLRIDPEILLGRLRRQNKNRPLIADMTDDELNKFVPEKLSEREKWYHQCDFMFEPDKTSLEFLEKQILTYIK